MIRVRVFIAVLVLIGLVLTGRRVGRTQSAPKEPSEKVLRPYDAPGQTGSGDRSPLDPSDPELSAGAAKKLGEED
jgi:hypothetical protein